MHSKKVPLPARSLSAAPVFCLALCLAGCTLYPEQKKPTLGTTTSAEATQRIFWDDVTQGKWTEANALLAPDVVVRVGTRVLNHQEAMAWLKGLQITSAAIGDTRIKGSLNDMILVYTLQLMEKAEPAACPGHGGLGASGSKAPQPSQGASMMTLETLAVWQEPELDPKASKKQQSAPAYLMTVLDLTPLGTDVAKGGGCIAGL